ncbi:MAG: phosphate signaling complex protein PhoU [Planctomycetaceae bacterium]|nr:phosphate signaling complex protein PhoU [Planctomycetaceae bacterium]
MANHLQHDLEKLEKQLLYLAAQVEDAVRKAMHALLDRKQDVALDVIAGDQGIDRREVELEEECLKVLALHQPVAADLRFTAACLKIDNDLERIGDLAVNIAERAAFLTTVRPFPVPHQLKAMMEEATRMLRESLDAFVNGDVDAARRICAEDEEVDRLHREIARALIKMMESDREAVEPGMQMFSVSKALERVADHATNIAEDVIYMVQGDIVRHGNRTVRTPKVQR